MNTTREALERPFPPDAVRRRPGRNGEEIVYLESTTVIGRLNEALAGEWSFVIESHDILDDEVVVLGRLTSGSIAKSAFGSSGITRTRDGGKPVSIGDDLKAAATDSLKKASTLLGVGLHLQGGPTGATDPAGRRAPAPDTNGNAYLSSAQFRAIHAIRRKLGWSDAELAERAVRLTGTREIERLDKRTASTFIERLQAEVAPSGASR